MRPNPFSIVVLVGIALSSRQIRTNFAKHSTFCNIRIFFCCLAANTQSRKNHEKCGRRIFHGQPRFKSVREPNNIHSNAFIYRDSYLPGQHTQPLWSRRRRLLLCCMVHGDRVRKYKHISSFALNFFHKSPRSPESPDWNRAPSNATLRTTLNTGTADWEQQYYLERWLFADFSIFNFSGNFLDES